MPNDSGGTRSRSGGMSVSLASPDGRVVGGGVAGLLVAASPVQVWPYSLSFFPYILSVLGCYCCFNKLEGALRETKSLLHPQ